MKEKKKDEQLPLLAKLAIPLSCLLLMFIFAYVYMDREQFYLVSIVAGFGTFTLCIITGGAILIAPLWDDIRTAGKIYDKKTGYYYHRDELYKPTPMKWEKVNNTKTPQP